MERSQGFASPKMRYFRAATQSHFLVGHVEPWYLKKLTREQEQSTGVIIMDNEDPDAIDVVLEYIYTLSDRTKACNSWQIDYEDHDKLLADLKHLLSVIVTADMFLLPQLVDLAGGKARDHTVDISYGIEKGSIHMTKKLFLGLVRALYPKRDCLALHSYQSQITEAIVIAKGNIWEKFGTRELLEEHPKLGMDVIESKTRLVQDKEAKIEKLIEVLPKTKKRRFESYQADFKQFCPIDLERRCCSYLSTS
jgi:hypothetical protein